MKSRIDFQELAFMEAASHVDEILSGRDPSHKFHVPASEIEAARVDAMRAISRDPIPDAREFAMGLPGVYVTPLLAAYPSQDTAADRGLLRVPDGPAVRDMRRMGLIHYGKVPTLTYFAKKVREHLVEDGG